MVSLGYLPDGGPKSWAHDVSLDGSVVVGTADDGTDSGHNHAFRWTQATGMQDLGTLPDVPYTSSTAWGASANGDVVVGESEWQAFRWTEATGMVPLGFAYPEIAHFSEALAVSGDGSVVVGRAKAPASEGYYTAFIWDEEHGMRDLRYVLLNQCGLTEVADWRFETATGISEDGMTICGYGSCGGDYAAWVATLPEPATLGLLAVGGLAMIRRRR
jgi:probable HAF family extracellular repeat protein